MREKLEDVIKHRGEEKAGQKVPGLGKMACKKTSKESLFSGHGVRSALRESLLSVWNVDTHHALRMRGQVEVNASDASYVP